MFIRALLKAFNANIITVDKAVEYILAQPDGTLDSHMVQNAQLANQAIAH
jgi:hypothetical protein